MTKVTRRKEGEKFKYFHLREYKNKMSDILFKRIMRLLADGEFDIVITTKTRGEAGYIDYETDSIYLNPKLFPIEETIIHEALHILKPNLSEEDIVELSSLLFEQLNDNKRDRLISYIKAFSTKWVGVKRSDIYATH